MSSIPLPPPPSVNEKLGGKTSGCLKVALVGGLIVLVLVIGGFFLLGNIFDVGGDILVKNSDKIVDESIRIQQEELIRQGKHEEAEAFAKEAEFLKEGLAQQGEQTKSLVQNAVKGSLPGGKSRIVQVLKEAHSTATGELVEFQDEILKVAKSRSKKALSITSIPAATTNGSEALIETLTEMIAAQREVLDELKQGQLEVIEEASPLALENLREIQINQMESLVAIQKSQLEQFSELQGIQIALTSNPGATAENSNDGIQTETAVKQSAPQAQEPTLGKESPTRGPAGLAQFHNNIDRHIERIQSDLNDSSPVSHVQSSNSDKKAEIREEFVLDIIALEKAYSSGDMDAAAKLSICYRAGFGVKADMGKAFELAKEAATSQDFLGAYALMCCYRDCVGTKYHDERKEREFAAIAVSQIPTVVQSDDLWGQYAKAKLLEGTKDSESDPIQSLEIHRLGVQQKFPPSLQNLAMHYLNGNVVTRDIDLAVKLFREAADLGWTPAAVDLVVSQTNGDHNTLSDVEIFTITSEAAKVGNRSAINLLGRLYLLGLGVEKDLKAAKTYFEAAADMGEGNAYVNLGMLYSNGQGVEKLPGTAAEMFQEGAVLGSGAAQMLLADCYFYGLGIEANTSSALALYGSAGEKGFARAQMSRASILWLGGRGVKQDKRGAISAWKKISNASWENTSPEEKEEIGEFFREMGEPPPWTIMESKPKPTASTSIANTRKKQEPATVAKSKVAGSFDFQQIKSKGDAKKRETLVFKGFYLGMPMVDAQRLLNHYLEEPQVSGDPVKRRGLGEMTDDEAGSVFVGALLGVHPEPEGPFKVFTAEKEFWIQRSQHDTPFAIANSDGMVVAFELSKRVRDELFDSEEMPTKEFLETFINAYDVPSLEPSRIELRAEATLFNSDEKVGFQNVLQHRSPKGFELTYWNDPVILNQDSAGLVSTTPGEHLTIKAIKTEKKRKATFD